MLERNEIEAKYKWDLSVIYADDATFMKEYAEAFDNIDIKVLEPRLKAVVFVARMKSPFGLYMLHVMQSTLQRIL